MYLTLVLGRQIYQRSSTFLDDYLEHFNVMFQRELPDLHQHILSQGFVIPMYGIEWFTTLVRGLLLTLDTGLTTHHGDLLLCCLLPDLQFSLSTKADLACAI